MNSYKNSGMDRSTDEKVKGRTLKREEFETRKLNVKKEKGGEESDCKERRDDGC